ncbi:MAG TPA: hypothetical protein PLL48_10380 [Novosphingobium sp.]|jgi:hypothetical protein|nr:hypothetical protein [Novosphingobium sp.]
MGYRNFALLAALVFPTVLTAAPPAPPQLKVSAIEARLFYGYSGKLSDDLLKRNPAFSGWNTIIGEGAAGEPADDLLVSVKVEPLVKPAGNEGIFSDQPVVVTATANGKVVAKRTFTSTLTNDEGVSWKGLYLRDIGCSGTLRIEAVAGRQRKVATLQFDCGE